MARAVRLCPSLVIVRPDFARYKDASQAVFRLFRAVTPLVEPLSLDEAYLDVTENAWGEALGRVVAQRLKAQIRETTGLTASAGVAPNKFLAKIASAWKKPDGLTVIAPERVEHFLQQAAGRCALGRRPGDRRATARTRNRAPGRRAQPPATRRCATPSAARPNGCVSSPTASTIVRSCRTASAKSCGSENTFSQDLTDLNEIRAAIDEMARDDAAWLERRALLCRTVTIKVRYSDFTTITRSHSQLAGDARMPTRLQRGRCALLDRTEAGQRPVRLLGVSVHNLVDPSEPPGGTALPFADDVLEPRITRTSRIGVIPGKACAARADSEAVSRTAGGLAALLPIAAATR